MSGAILKSRPRGISPEDHAACRRAAKLLRADEEHVFDPATATRSILAAESLKFRTAPRLPSMRQASSPRYDLWSAEVPRRAAARVLGNGFLYPAFTFSTSTAWTGTTTIPLGPAFVVYGNEGARGAGHLRR